MARRASSRQRGTAYHRRGGGRKTELSPRFVILSPATAGRGAASDGRVRDLLSANELAGRLSMAGLPALLLDGLRRAACLVGGARVR